MATTDNNPISLVPKPLPTEFAPAERAQPETTAAQAERFLTTCPDLQTILDAVPDVVIALNRQRQIVFANRSALALTGRQMTQLLGLRPGEALNCIHAYESEGGCGTTAFCSTCGAVRAILASQRGQANVEECRILVRDSNDALDLRVWAVPYQMNGERLTIFTIQDIRDEKRRSALERVFFHDVLNIAGALSFAAQIIRETRPTELQDLPELLNAMTEQLIEEIKAQRDLLNAENHELVVHPEAIDAQALLHAVVESYRQHQVAQGRTIQLAPSADPATIVSDPTLLRRVLGNMLKNALEATPASGTVTVGYRPAGDEIEFWVHNPTAMPRDVQLQVFQRSFSTKGRGRGLGTYSMKLLSERYLGGRITFDSSPATGTTFRATYPRTLPIPNP